MYFSIQRMKQQGLKIDQIARSYGDRIIYDKANFKIYQGDRIALKGKMVVVSRA